MKKRFGSILPIILICAVCASVAAIGGLYFNYISHSIYEDSTGHLKEIYGQVNRAFGSFIKKNWGLLESWEDFIEQADSPEQAREFIEERRDYWGFSNFRFISEDGSCMTLSGKRDKLDLGDSLERLFEDGEPILEGTVLADGTDVTLFAVPTRENTFDGFTYGALAVGYTNADLSKSLNVDAFSGKAKCFVVHKDGSVLLSTISGGSVFANYLTYLNTASDIGEDGIAALKNDWENGVTGIRRCKIGGEMNMVFYQPISYQDYYLLSVVSQSVVSAGFLSVQKTTINMLIAIFLIVSAAAVTIFILRSRSQSLRNRMELQYRELMFDVLSNNVDDIFIMLDNNDLNVDYISPNIERLLGIPANDVRENIRVMEKCDVNLNSVIPKSSLEKIPLNENIYHECEFVHQNTGERRWYRITVYHMQIQDLAKYIIVLSDRTQDRQMTQKLQEALNAARSANEAKSNFLFNMSHDIRTPMNAIVGFSVLLEKDADRPEKVREYTKKITASSHHLLSLINDVLDMSKIESGKTSLNVDKFSLPDLLKELGIILMPQAKAKNQDFRMYVQGAPPEQMLGDKLRLNQILINLLYNAIKYTPAGGKIDFIVSEISDEPKSASQYVKLRFVVEDNGIGMSKEFQREIFAPFSREVNSRTNSIQGTGLGMAITKNLVDLMGGIILVKSEEGKGSRFTVELSFALPDKEESEQWFRQKVKRILVADDEEEICRDIKELMRDTGVDVEFAMNGGAAVEAAVEASRKNEEYDVILLDWKMPGMNGVDAAKAIRERVGGHIPILVLTSYDWADIEDEARAAGINAFMAKPFFVSTFWRTIKPLFLGKNPGGENRDDISDEAAHEDSGVMKGRHFLIAEDNELNSEILTEMLSMEGATSELAVNGEEAVRMFTQSEPGHFDMIFMDVQMPVMNGYDATRKIRASDHPSAKTIPIAAMTANTFAEDVKNALDAGMDGHLAKPIDMDAVIRLTGELLGRSGNSSDNIRDNSSETALESTTDNTPENSSNDRPRSDFKEK